jgi:hypothetical protein
MPPKMQDDIIAACKSVPLNKLAEMMECVRVCVCVCVCVLTNYAVVISTMQHFNIGVTYVYKDKIQDEFL